MEVLTGVLVVSQLLFSFIVGLYFFNLLQNQRSSKSSIEADSSKQLEYMNKLRNIKLNKPISESTRPESFPEIIGQEKGIKALRAALCGPSPQHVIIYGPPGVGKTAAARIALKNAAASEGSPFTETSPFIEMDATILQFDERSIADPLIGSVHDPIYQGAGAYGSAGIPQPKWGAVTNAHGGILFIDEIGEMHNMQMNKLLKVLEDRKVILSSSYYTKDNETIPKHIHDIFTNGLPADFRLVGATTRTPEQLPPALRSRCTEVFFRGLNSQEVMEIAKNAFKKVKFSYTDDIPKIISGYCQNGRDTVNVVQTAISIAMLENRSSVTTEDIEQVIEYGRYTKSYTKKIQIENRVGVVNGLAVSGGDSGIVIEIEATAAKCEPGKGTFKVTGIIEEEELGQEGRRLKRHSTAKSSVDNVITVLSKSFAIKAKDYDLHLNFVGGMPIDGPSAGVAILTAIYSAVTGKKLSSEIAMTGEVTIKGKINPVGGVPAKIEAAIEAGAKKVIIPKENYQKYFSCYNIEIITVENINQLIMASFISTRKQKSYYNNAVVTATGLK